MKVRDSGMPEVDYWESLFDTDLILERMKIGKQIDSITEFGTGYGTFTIPIAKIISGKIYSYDIEKEMIEFTKVRALVEKANNIELQVKDLLEEGTALEDSSMDYSMLFNILHHSEPEVFLNESYRILKKGGLVGVIHWNYDESTPRGPKMEIRPKPEIIFNLIQKAGFLVLKPFFVDLPPYHYGIIGIK